jgi:hypothetical protein
MKRKHLLPLSVWTLLWGLFFVTLLLAAERLPNSDFSGQFHAFGLFQAQEIAAGRLPVWSPGSYGGIPFAADTQAAVFYPLRWLTILFSLPGGFSYYALELEGLLHIWLAGAFAYFLAFDITRDHSKKPHVTANGRRRALAGLRPEQWAGLIASVAFGLGGYLTSYPLLQLAVLESVAWLPLVLYLLRRGVQPYETPASGNSSQISALLAAGIVLGISALAGHPQTFLHVAYLAAAYYLFLAWQARWRWHWIVGLGAVIGTVSIGVSAAAFLPAIRFVPLTVRGDISYEFVGKGFPLLQYIQVLLPGPLSVWLPQYAGIVTIFFVLLAWFGRRHWRERTQQAETVFWFIVVLFAAWLSLGDKGVLFELAYRIAPGFSFFRQQERLVSLFVLGLALLAAQGLVIWMRANRTQRQLWLRRASVVLAAGLLLIGFILFMSRTAVGQNDWLSLWIRQWLIVAVLVVICWPRYGDPNPKWDGWRSMAILLILSLDLFLPVRRAMDLQRESPTVFWPQPAWLNAMADDEVTRIDGQNQFHVNLGEVYGLEDVKGISPLKPQLAADVEDLPRQLRWRLLNVKYVLAEKPIEENLTEVAEITESIIPGENAEAFVYRFENALARAWMVYDPIIAPDDGRAFKLVRQPGFDPAEKVILTNPTISDLDGIVFPDQPPFVDIERLSGSELSFIVETQTPGVLVISEWALPGWQATLNGLAVPLLRADYALQALVVPAGRNEVVLSYVARDVQVGVLVLLLTLVLTAVVAWRWHPVITTRPIMPEGEKPVQPYLEWPDWRRSLAINHARWIMVAVVLLGFGLRLFLLGNQELRGDEAFSFLFAQLPLSEVVPELVDQGDPHSPLHYLMLNGWVDLAGVSELSMRWLSLLPGLLLIPVIFRLGCEMAGRRVGIMAALMTAVSPSLIWLAQDIRNQYTLAMLFTSLATWLLVNINKSTVSRSTKMRVGMWVLYAILCAIAIYSHYYAVFALLAHGLYLWFVPERRRSLLPWIVSGLAAAVLFSPWLIAILAELLEAGQLNDPSTPDLAQYLVTAGRELIIGASLPGRWTRWLVLGMAALVLAGFFALRRKRPGWAAMLIGWLAGAMLVIFLIRFNRSTFNAFYVSVASPAWVLLLAAGVSFFWQRGGWRRGFALVGLIALFASTIASLRNYYFDPVYSRSLGYRDVAAVLQEEVEEDDFFIAHFPDPSLDYYLRDVPMPRQMFPAAVGQSVEEIEKALAQVAGEHDRLWLVPYNRSVWDRENVVPRWLAKNNLQEQETQLHRLNLNAYRPLHSSDEMVLPLDSALNDELLLDSVFVTANGRPVDFTQPLTLDAGAQLQTTLIWSALEGTPRSYTAFVHLLDENGFLVAQHDGVPVDGTRPTTTWQAGEQLLDIHDLVVPDGVQGNGRLVIGLYDSETLQRQDLAPGQDALHLLEIQYK